MHKPGLHTLQNKYVTAILIKVDQFCQVMLFVFGDGCLMSCTILFSFRQNLDQDLCYEKFRFSSVLIIYHTFPKKLKIRNNKIDFALWCTFSSQSNEERGICMSAGLFGMFSFSLWQLLCHKSSYEKQFLRISAGRKGVVKLYSWY